MKGMPFDVEANFRNRTSTTPTERFSRKMILAFGSASLAFDKATSGRESKGIVRRSAIISAYPSPFLCSKVKRPASLDLVCFHFFGSYFTLIFPALKSSSPSLDGTEVFGANDGCDEAGRSSSMISRPSKKSVRRAILLSKRLRLVQGMTWIVPELPP